MTPWFSPAFHRPPLDVPVLVYQTNGDMTVATTPDYRRWFNAYEDEIGEPGFAQVTHWTELPGPPQ